VPVVARLVEAGLVFQRGMPPTAEYLFKHALVQDTAYSTLLRGPRQALHRRIAEVLEQRFPDLVQTRPEIVAHHYGDAAMADKAIGYWHLAGQSSFAKSAVREAVAQLRRGLSLLNGLPETRERKQLELDIQVTLTPALMAGKGYADPEVIAALERANRLVTETAAVGTPLHFSVLLGLWLSTFNRGAIAAALEHAANYLSVAQSRPSPDPLLVGHRILGQSLIQSGDYRAALAHLETAASLYRPEEHRDSAFRDGRDIGVQAFVMLSWALWHRGYPDQSARAADRALAYSRELGHAWTLVQAFWFAAMAAVFARDVATASAYGNDCVALASEHGFAQWAAYGRVLVLRSHRLDGLVGAVRPRGIARGDPRLSERSSGTWSARARRRSRRWSARPPNLAARLQAGTALGAAPASLSASSIALPGAEIFLDPLDRRRRRRFEERGSELDAVGAVVDPAPAGLDELAGRNHRRVTEDGDQVALTAGFDAQHAEAVLFVVERDALDEGRLGPRLAYSPSVLAASRYDGGQDTGTLPGSSRHGVSGAARSGQAGDRPSPVPSPVWILMRRSQAWELRNRWFADSSLEGRVRSEPVSEMGFLGPGIYGSIPRRLWMMSEA